MASMKLGGGGRFAACEKKYGKERCVQHCNEKYGAEHCQDMHAHGTSAAPKARASMKPNFPSLKDWMSGQESM